MMLSVDITRQLRPFTLQVSFEAPTGVTALFGKSGSGKTSVVNAVAGLLRPEKGRISLGGRTLFDATTGVNLRPNFRKVGYVFQDARLFPHMNVEKNLFYGGNHDAGRLIALLGLEDLLGRFPQTLSGGEAQRVALARALMTNPDILLMDEPLAALDQARKDEILPYFERLRDETGVPILYVSHDLTEVARLATTLVVLEAGRVVQNGHVDEVLSDPAALMSFGPREAGAVITGQVSDYDPKDGLSEVAFNGGALTLPGRVAEIGARIRVQIKASDIILSLERPENVSALNVLAVTVEDVNTGQGPGVAVSLRLGETRLLARVTRRSAHLMRLEPGKEIFAMMKAVAVDRSVL